MQKLLFMFAASLLFSNQALAQSKVGGLPCTQGLRSLSSDVPVTVTFRNQTSIMRRITWLDFNGNRVDYAQIQPGEQYTINTFATHPWEFSDGPGNCTEMFMPVPGVQVFDLTLEADPQSGD